VSIMFLIEAFVSSCVYSSSELNGFLNLETLDLKPKSPNINGQFAT
jgi:hypothetical protein